MKGIIDTLLLLALPASGKSEVRTYLRSLKPERCRADFHLGTTVQLDDFPYVHLMRRIDEELLASGRERIFFQAPERSFRDGRDWGTLVELVNQDDAALRAPAARPPSQPAEHLFARIDEAGRRAGLRPRLAALEGAARGAVARALRREAAEHFRALAAARPDSLEGRTVVIEFARGGPEGSAMPLPPPHGYAYALSLLSERILSHASVLYVWVTPEESRRKNRERARPDEEGSILHHGVPEAVMRGEYGCDDMEWLLEHSDRPATIRVEAHGRVFHLPVARFDNRVDRTSFAQRDEPTWTPAEVQALHEGLKEAFAALGGGS